MVASHDSSSRRIRTAGAVTILLSLLVLGLAMPVAAGGPRSYGEWELAAPVAEVNTPAPVNDGCPIESPDGRQLYIASNRTGTLGGNDIWVANRPHKGAPWGPMVNLGPTVNGIYNDFCPTPLGAGFLLFVSERPGEGTCEAGVGKGDIYITRQRFNGTWTEPRHLGCDADGTGPNFPGGEFGPSLVHTWQGTFLYFSSTGYGTDMNIYVSRMRWNGTFAPATVVAELSTPTSADFMPNVRRDGLEIVFNSNRTDLAGAQGGQDIYVSTRSRTSDPWSTPVNLGTNVNTAGNETRSSLSGDGTRLHFGRDGDVHVSHRSASGHHWDD
jgi:hypothetical protein